MARIEHPEPDFDGWQTVFDDDPAGRAKVKPCSSPNSAGGDKIIRLLGGQPGILEFSIA